MSREPADGYPVVFDWRRPGVPSREAGPAFFDLWAGKVRDGADIKGHAADQLLRLAMNDGMTSREACDWYRETFGVSPPFRKPLAYLSDRQYQERRRYWGQVDRNKKPRLEPGKGGQGGEPDVSRTTRKVRRRRERALRHGNELPD